MKNLSSFALLVVLSLSALTAAGMTVARPQSPLSKVAGPAIPEPISHGDSVTSDWKADISSVLLQPQTGTEVRVVSWTLNFRREQKLIGQFSGQRVVEDGKSDPIQFAFQGIDPNVATIEGTASLVPTQAYSVTIHPFLVGPWSAAKSRSDLVIDVVRTK
jgi:hypothetical protein